MQVRAAHGRGGRDGPLIMHDMTTPDQSPPSRHAHEREVPDVLHHNATTRVLSRRGRQAGTTCGALPPVTFSRSIRSTHGVLVEHHKVLSRQNLHGAPVRLAPQHSWYNLWNHTAGALSRSLRSTQGVLVEHQRVLVTVESPRGACLAVLRKPRSRTTRVLAHTQHRERERE